MKVAVRVFSAMLLLVLGMLAFIYFSPDYNIYFVRSESMVPTINLGDLVITGPVGGPLTPLIKPGTIITYNSGKGEVTHRVLSITPDWHYITKGDNSEDPDPTPVSMSQVKGVYILKIPYLGYLTSFIRTKVGWYIAIIVPTMLLVALIIKDIVKEALKSEG